MNAYELTYLQKHTRTVHAPTIEEANRLAREFIRNVNRPDCQDPDYKLLQIFEVTPCAPTHSIRALKPSSAPTSASSPEDPLIA